MAKWTSKGKAAVFSEKTLKCLHSAGWAPGREVSIEIYEAAFAEEQLQLPSKVRSFLRHFGGLIITYMNMAEQADTIDFLADEAVEGLGNGALRSYEELVGSARLCPIGHYAFGTCLLMMNSLGEVYGGLDLTLYHIGKSGPHAVENMVTGQDINTIHHGSAGKVAEG